ncbi:MAG: hypothetical protein U0841_22245 [Chloroflexia bacterium]
MASWRRIAMVRFPHLRQELHDRHYTIYGLYFDLLPMARAAHDADDSETLRQIYTFAGWCFAQRNKDLWNAAAVAFYEHLFDRRDQWLDVLPWLSDKVIKDCWGLWELRLTQEELQRLRRLIGQRSSS